MSAVFEHPRRVDSLPPSTVIGSDVLQTCPMPVQTPDDYRRWDNVIFLPRSAQVEGMTEAMSEAMRDAMREAMPITVIISGIDKPSVSQSRTPRQAQLQKDLAEFQALPDGWDGEDSFAPSAAAMVAIRAAIRELPPGIDVPRATLGASGEVSIYWDDARIFLEISADQEGDLSLFLRNKEARTSQSIEKYAIQSDDDRMHLLRIFRAGSL